MSAFPRLLKAPNKKINRKLHKDSIVVRREPKIKRSEKSPEWDILSKMDELKRDIEEKTKEMDKKSKVLSNLIKEAKKRIKELEKAEHERGVQFPSSGWTSISSIGLAPTGSFGVAPWSTTSGTSSIDWTFPSGTTSTIQYQTASYLQPNYILTGTRARQIYDEILNNPTTTRLEEYSSPGMDVYEYDENWNDQ